MKILIVSNMFPDKKHPSTGIFVKRFCDELEKMSLKYELSVMHWYDSKLGKIKNYLVFYLGTFLKIMLKKYSVIYIHYASNSSVPVLWALKLKRFKVFTNVHGSDVVPENPIQKKFQRFTKEIVKKSELIIVPSEYFKEYVAHKYNLDSSIIKVYPSSGVNTTFFRPLRPEKIEEIKNKYGINPDLKTFCYVSRISSNKGWDTFLKAIHDLKKREVKANFILVGDGAEKEACYTMASELGILESLVCFPLLSQDELLLIYNISDALIFPTKREGESLGLVAIEAMACATPVIASNFAAPKYYVKNDWNGYKFEKDNYKQLAETMLLFINNIKRKEDFYEGCIKTSKQYDVKNIFMNLKEIFEGL